MNKGGLSIGFLQYFHYQLLKTQNFLQLYIDSQFELGKLQLQIPYTEGKEALSNAPLQDFGQN